MALFFWVKNKCGRVQEWLNWTLSKSVVPFTRYRGFESHLFRQELIE